MSTRYELAYLTDRPERIFAGRGTLTNQHRIWTQHPMQWSIFYYHHYNSLSIGTQTYSIEPNDMAVFAPSVRIEHAIVGEEAGFDFFAFDLPAKSGIRVAVPHVVKDFSVFYDNLRKANSRVVDTALPAIAFIWNTLWYVSESPAVFRGLEIMYEAEAYILRRLSEHFTISEMCDDLSTSQRRLLDAFRQEHGVSIQEFILRKRIMEANRLLLTTEMPIKEVAAKVGYLDLQHFNKSMRHMTGKSPRFIRESSGEATMPGF